MIKPGHSAEATLVVSAGDTAAALALSPDDTFPEVFATARMIALMEVAASRLMQPMLEAGQLSVGVSVNVTHTAPTPVGATVKATATYLRPEGKLFRFHVAVADDAGVVGEGEHTRAIVDNQRMLSRAANRKSL
jgi:fluoroacetyl-CoA thioesterase